jgi:hypothetical protein
LERDRIEAAHLLNGQRAEHSRQVLDELGQNIFHVIEGVHV